MKKLTLSLLAAGLAALTLASCGGDAVETTAGKTPSGSTPSGSVSVSATTPDGSTPVVTTKPTAAPSTPAATSGTTSNSVTPPSTPGATEDLAYTIDVDLTIVDGNAGIIFSGTDASNFVMWQLAVGEYDDGCLWLRPHTWTNGNGRCVEEICLNTDVEALANVSADLGVKYRMTLRVFNDGSIETLIDGISAGTTDAAASMVLTDTVGLIGFRCDAYKNGTVPEIGAFDNLKITNAAGEVLYEDDFSSEDSTLCSALIDGNKVVLEDGALKITGKYLNMADLGI